MGQRRRYEEQKSAGCNQHGSLLPVAVQTRKQKSEEAVVPKAAPAKLKWLSLRSEGEPVKAAPKQVEESGANASSAAANFETIYFGFDKSDLTQAARDVLSKNADIALKASNAKIQIEGHCDERGSAEYNLALGERRAKSSMQYLVTLGVKADRLSTISYGKEKPAVKGNDEAAWSKNRRAEFIVK
jgi:peptidoglycan-associated lipoprotein